MRAILFARATATSLGGFSASILRSHGSANHRRRPQNQQLSQVPLPHLGDPSQPLPPARGDFARCQANPRREVAPPGEALHRRCEGVHRHRPDLSHPRNRHQSPQLLVRPHDRPHLLVDLVELRVQLIDPVKQQAGRGHNQLGERFGALGERLPQLLDIGHATRRDQTELRQVTPQRVDRLRALSNQEPPRAGTPSSAPGPAPS